MITITYMLELEKPNISRAPINSLFVVLMGWNQVRLQSLANWWNELNLKRFMWKRWKLNWCTHLEFKTQTFSLLKICCTFYFLCFEQSCQFFTLDRNFFVGLWEATQFIFYLVRKVFFKKKTITNLFDYS